MNAPYRTGDEEASASAIIKNVDRYTINYRDPCPSCGNSDWASFGMSWTRKRIHVPARRHWWQFWRPLVGYNKRKCDACGCRVRELLPSPKELER